MSVKDRFLNYISIFTTSDESTGTHPSTMRQFDLARILEKELKEIGLLDVVLTDTCYVYGRIPATAGCEDVKSIALISHMDTAPDFSGENVKPQIIENYDGKDVVLGDSGRVLSVSDFPELPSLAGRTLITTDGTTLLGADDKAGVAAIVTAADELLHSDAPHGEIWICFTPDEEIGEGPDHFELDRIHAAYGYTVDGGYEGEIAYENFNASSAKITVHGVNVHPGEAKDIMVNAGLIAADLAASLPKNETPAATEGYEGFYHLIEMQGNVEKATLTYILRDHDADKLKVKQEKLTELVAKINEQYGEGTAEIAITHSYDNMISIVKEHMEIVHLAEDAIRAQGIEPVTEPIRGGTDGAQLTFKGLPCPNLGTGGYGYHGPYEHVTVEAMETVVKILKHIMTHVA
ncbi:tripeptide aminopeptidase [Lachnospiraceae bacterium C10]|nr:tripeptide aminopeptidase [Lachnospiraceae bacterium C10]